MRRKLLINESDLYDNPAARTPVGLTLDTSASMLTTKGGTPTGEIMTIDGKRYRVVTGGTTRLDELQQGLQKFYDALYQDPKARDSAEVAIVTFDDTAKLLQDFSRIEHDGKKLEPPKLETGDRTSLGAGINLTLDYLEKRKLAYKTHGIDYYQPWLVILSDGENNGSQEELDRARARIYDMVAKDGLCVYPFIIGTNEGMKTLASLSPKQPPMRIEQTNIQELFVWLYKSMPYIAAGRPAPACPFGTSEWNSGFESKS